LRRFTALSALPVCLAGGALASASAIEQKRLAKFRPSFDPAPKWKASKTWFKIAGALFPVLMICFGANYAQSSAQEKAQADAQAQQAQVQAQQIAVEETKSPLQRYQECHATGDSINDCRRDNEDGYAAWLRARGVSEDAVQGLVASPTADAPPGRDAAKDKAVLGQGVY